MPMNNHRSYNLRIANHTIIIFVLWFNFSCKKFVDIPPPINPIVSEVVFANDNMATGTVTGIYHEMMNGLNSSNQFTSAGVTLYAGMSADELRYFIQGTRDEFIKNQISESNHAAISSLFWDRAYKYIYTANLCIEQLTGSSKVTDSVKNRLLGECYFIRAFCYFHLVNLFGDVPLTTSSDYRTNESLSRRPVNEVYTLIINDLVNACNRLPPTNTSLPRPDKWAAASLLARVYLYRKNWIAAEDQANAVIGSGHFQLEADPDHVFAVNSKEAIWQLIPVNSSVNTWEGNQIIPITVNSAPTYILTDTLLRAFETGDQRKLKWVKMHRFGLDSFHYPFKYKIKNSNQVTEYYTVLRLAELYLIRAEARAYLNKTMEARQDLDVIRARAGLPATAAATQSELLTAIEQERRIELFAEWGNRWYDLKRTGRADEILAQNKYKTSTWSHDDLLWPIPNGQIYANPALKQNPGY